MNDFEIPVAAAAEIAAEYLSATLQSHSRRVYLWAAGIAAGEGIRYDEELLFVAAMFHDIALVPVFDSHTVSFEEAGGHVAQVFAAGAGWPAERRRLHEVIVRHMWPKVDPAEDPEGYLISRAAAPDIVGRDYAELSASYRAAVLERFPRRGLTAEFLACFQAQAERKPDSTAARAIEADLATRILANPLDAPKSD